MKQKQRFIVFTGTPLGRTTVSVHKSKELAEQKARRLSQYLLTKTTRLKKGRVVPTGWLHDIGIQERP